MGRNAHMFAELAVVGVLDLRKAGPISGACREGRKEGKKTDLVEVVLVELANKGRKV